MTVSIPTLDSPHLQKLLNKLKAEFEPELVPVRIDADAKTQSCYFNVERRVQQHGGKIHFGWAVWQTDYLCEAEHHAVWENDNGELLDVTPRDIAFESILFISDNNKKFQGKSIDNIRVNSTANPLVENFIFYSEEIEKLYSDFGKRENNDVLLLPKPVQDYIEHLEVLRNQLCEFIDAGGKLGSQCYCRSFKAYNKCHGKNLLYENSSALAHLKNKYPSIYKNT